MGTDARVAELEKVESAPGPVLTRRDEIAVAFFASWTILGLFLDGWAHQANKPETFFSPWHGVLYSGFGAAQLYFAREAWRSRRSPVRTITDPLMAAGLALFIVGAVGDFAWHEIFGIEVDLEALLSPTHLALMVGGLLMVSGPVRSAWKRAAERAPSFRTFAPTLVCLTLLAALASFFLMYLSAFNAIWSMGTAAARVTGEAGETLEVAGIAAILVTNALLLGSTLLVLRRWTPPFGTFTFLFGVVALMTSGLNAFDSAPLIVPAVVAGAVADYLARRTSVRVLACVVPLVLWLCWFGVYELAWGLGWATELWTGSVILSVVSGLGLSVLVFPPSTARADVLDGNVGQRSA